MDIQNEQQAAKVRAVMGAMIGKLQTAKAAGDKAAVVELKAQYTTLQVALQGYKATTITATPPKAAPPPKKVAAELEKDALIKDLRATIWELEQELGVLREEVRALRRPQTNPTGQTPVSLMQPPAIDLAAEITALTGRAI